MLRDKFDDELKSKVDIDVELNQFDLHQCKLLLHQYKCSNRSFTTYIIAIIIIIIIYYYYYMVKLLFNLNLK